MQELVRDVPVVGGPGGLRPAPPERRAWATVVDAALWSTAPVATAAGLTLSGAPGLVTLVGAVVVAVLATVLAGVVTGLDGRSPGRLAAGLRVLAVDGGPLGATAGIRRSGSKALAGLGSCGVVWLRWGASGIAALDGARRTPLDVRSASVVVDVRPQPAPRPASAALPRGPVNLTAQRLAVPEEPGPPEGGAAPAVLVPGVRVPAQRTAAPSLRTQRTQRTQRTLSTLPDADPGGWRIVADTGESVRLEGAALVGRDPAPVPGVRHLVALRSDDGSLSRHHVRVGPVADGRLVVLDDSSTNGTVLVRSGTSRRVPRGRPLTLLEGDRLQVGDRWLTIHRDTRLGTR